MNYSRRKRFLLGFVLTVLVGLLVLAGGVSTLDVTTHTIYQLPKNEEPVATPEETLPEINYTNYLSVLGMVVALLIPLSVVYLLLSPEARRRFLMQMIQVGFVLVVIYLFTTKAWRNIASIFRQSLAEGMNLPGNIEVKTLEPFAPQNPTWLAGLISFLVAAVMVFITFRLFLLLRLWLGSGKTSSEKLEESARRALGRIQAGDNLRNVILRCYQEMTQAVSEKRQISRLESATPREFTRDLEDAGLPAEYVERLTRLFELARYGAQHPGHTEEAEAIACLNAIIAYLNREALAGGVMEDSALGGKA